MLVDYAIVISSLSFFGYGIACLRSEFMKEEFRRYGLSSFRSLTGWLQLAGATGLLIGYLYPPSTFIAAAGLALQMFLGVCVRVKIRDGFVRASPAFFYMLLNAFIAWKAF